MVFRVSFVVFRVSFVVFRVSFVVFRVSFVAFYRVSFVTTPCFNRGQAVVKGLTTERGYDQVVSTSLSTPLDPRPIPAPLFSSKGCGIEEVDDFVYLGSWVARA